jgi:hypothetical protein
MNMGLQFGKDIKAILYKEEVEARKIVIQRMEAEERELRDSSTMDVEAMKEVSSLL